MKQVTLAFYSHCHAAYFQASVTLIASFIFYIMPPYASAAFPPSFSCMSWIYLYGYYFNNISTFRLDSFITSLFLRDAHANFICFYRFTFNWPLSRLPLSQYAASFATRCIFSALLAPLIRMMLALQRWMPTFMPRLDWKFRIALKRHFYHYSMCARYQSIWYDYEAEIYIILVFFINAFQRESSLDIHDIIHATLPFDFFIYYYFEKILWVLNKYHAYYWHHATTRYSYAGLHWIILRWASWYISRYIIIYIISASCQIQRASVN